MVAAAEEKDAAAVAAQAQEDLENLLVLQEVATQQVHLRVVVL